jgi:hypothetical protein
MHRMKVEATDYVLNKKETLERELVEIKEKVAAKKEAIKTKVADGFWYVIEQAYDPTPPDFTSVRQQQPTHQQQQPAQPQQLYSAI